MSVEVGRLAFTEHEPQRRAGRALAFDVGCVRISQVSTARRVGADMTTIFLVAQDHEERGERILSDLVRAPYPLGDTAGVRYPAPPEVARAELAARLDAVDAEWRRFVALL